MEEKHFNNEAYTDIMKIREQETFYKSKGTEAPVTAHTVEEAKESLKQAERELYHK